MSVYLNICSSRSVSWAVVNAMHLAVNKAHEAGIQVGVGSHIGDSLISRARNASTQAFLKTPFTHFMSVDDDIVLPPNAIVDLVAAKCSIIAGMYRIKNETRVAHKIGLKNMHRLKDALNFGKVIPAMYCSTGCLMIERQVIEAMIRAYPELDYKHQLTKETHHGLYIPYVHTEEGGDPEYLSEDWAFCQRAREIGYERHVHGGVLCDHLGEVAHGMGLIQEVLNKQDGDSFPQPKEAEGPAR